ncbi:MAG TPA: hypothetical protein VER36_12130 [Flavisolibacter sp.]|nr:hypothetical protein [Flavisolibacter sp.]
MNTYLHSFKTYFDNVIHPAAGKSDAQKSKRKSSKTTSYFSQASPDCLNIRAAVRSQNNVRRNPAP